MRITHHITDGKLDSLWDYGPPCQVQVPASSMSAEVTLIRDYKQAVFALEHRDLRCPRDIAVGGVCEQDDLGLLRRRHHQGKGELSSSQVRSVINRAWRRAEAERFRPQVHEYVTRAIDSATGYWTSDLVSIAADLTDETTMLGAGVSHAEARALRSLSDQTTGTLLHLPFQHKTAAAGWSELYDFTRPLLARARDPGYAGDDLITATTRLLDGVMTREETNLTVPTAHNGFGTMKPTIISVMAWLLAKPELRAMIAADRSLIPAVRDQALRDSAHFTFGLPGLLTAPLDGIAEGTPVLPVFRAAHQDPVAVYHPHLAWGRPPHVCLGRHLATVVLDEVIAAVSASEMTLVSAGPLQEGTMPVPAWLRVTAAA